MWRIDCQGDMMLTILFDTSTRDDVLVFTGKEQWMLADIISSSLPDQLIVLIIAALPVVELRGAVPVAMEVFNMPWYQALVLSIIGNLLPVPLLLLFYDALNRTVSRVKIGRDFLGWVHRRANRQVEKIEKYKKQFNYYKLK